MPKNPSPQSAMIFMMGVLVIPIAMRTTTSVIIQAMVKGSGRYLCIRLTKNINTRLINTLTSRTVLTGAARLTAA